MCLPIKKRSKRRSVKSIYNKTYDELQFTLTLLEVMICLNIRRYLAHSEQGFIDQQIPEDSWITNAIRLISNNPELGAPGLFSSDDDDDDDDDDIADASD